MTPDWLLERLAAGDLPQAEAEALRIRLENEPGGLARLQAIEASNREILARHPPARVAAAIRHRADGAAPRRLFPLALAAPAVAALAVFLLLPTTSNVPGEGPEVIRLKGAAPKLVVHRNEAGNAAQLADGATARARDLLQLSYQAGGHAYGVVLSLDGNGNVTLHLPDSGAAAARLDPNGAVALPQAYELDDAPAFERFVFVAADEPFAVETAMDAARWLTKSRDPQHTELPLPASLTQTSFLVKKVP